MRRQKATVLLSPIGKPAQSGEPVFLFVILSALFPCLLKLQAEADGPVDVRIVHGFQQIEDSGFYRF